MTNASRPLMFAVLFLVWASVVGATSRADTLTWQPAEFDQRCKVTDSLAYNMLLEQFAIAATGAYNKTTGCVTTHYLEGDYDPDGTLGVSSLAHAGIDLRSHEKRPATVRALASGVVRVALLPEIGRSTLMIDTTDGNYAVLYLHMSKILVTSGSVKAGQPIGVIGDVGALSRHLHIEVWSKRSRQFSREQAITHSACRTKPCTKSEVAELTVDPLTILFYDDAASLGQTKFTQNEQLRADVLAAVELAAVAERAALRKERQALEHQREIQAAVIPATNASARAKQGAPGHAVLQGYRLAPPFGAMHEAAGEYSGEVTRTKTGLAPHGWGVYDDHGYFQEYRGQWALGRFDGPGIWGSNGGGQISYWKAGTPVSKLVIWGTRHFSFTGENMLGVSSYGVMNDFVSKVGFFNCVGVCPGVNNYKNNARIMATFQNRQLEAYADERAFGAEFDRNGRLIRQGQIVPQGLR